ncbi:MAG: type II toxin-antitoxin system VapC family toxin [Coriobacteriales bacterium]|jgi:predicted nucleic acid-binding protein|nr:type II toxin-antitoxin system VapC family toxin [Coriobacteriales bacterium]
MKTMLVMDCSAAVAIIRKTNEGVALRALMEDGEKVITSQLFLIELGSVFRKYVKSGAENQQTATRCLERAVDLIDSFVDISENYLEAFSEALRLDRSPYDMFYFTLARRNAATLCTLDRALMRLCEREGVECIHELRL